MLQKKNEQNELIIAHQQKQKAPLNGKNPHECRL